MYLRRTQRRTKDGGAVGYLQLAHNVWDRASRQSRVRVIHSFGREDELDRTAIVRLIGSLQRVLEPGQVLEASADDEQLRFVESRPMGGALMLDGLWRRLGIDTVMSSLLQGRRLDPGAERVLFALVANRALEPLSKLAATAWVSERAWIDGLPGVSDDACYRAMDWLLEIEEQLCERVYWQTADLLNLEVDLLFFDTTSTYFETDRADEPIVGADGDVTPAFRSYGHSKDHRPDLPQVRIGMAVTRTAIPIRVWCWPGNQSEQELIRQVKDDLREWKLSRAVWVADRGFQSAENRRYLQRCGGHYIIGEKLRGDSKEAKAALSRQGRYRTVAGNLQIKEVVLDDGTMRDRFVICRNPEQAERDQHVRDELIAQLDAQIAGSDKLQPEDRVKLHARVKTKRGLGRFLRTTATGLLRIDRAAVNAEAHLDGKYLLRSSDPTLSAEDIALGYKQLLQVERGWRDLKTTLDLRPVHHRREDRIRAHVLLCWLALLLIRIIEQETSDTWRNVRNELQRLQQGTFAGPAGTCQQRTELTSRQRDLLRTLKLAEPARFTRLDPTPAPPATPA